MLDHFLHRQFDFADDIISAVAVRIPQLDTEVLICFNKFGRDKQATNLSVDNQVGHLYLLTRWSLPRLGSSRR